MKYFKTSPKAKKESVELPAGSTVADLLDEYCIPREKAHMILVNRERAVFETTLRDGDEVWVLPLAHGG